jgi:hypothetical protein
MKLVLKTPKYSGHSRTKQLKVQGPQQGRQQGRKADIFEFELLLAYSLKGLCVEFSRKSEFRFSIH